ncbi:hypothetical protein Bca52824_080294 [Brassica carinata]|uniref:Secreted protein n=1 Tax=Brassica carinata TaxID=52824 RepID=A0A8X7PGD0_BRACI|nr:hypothetical protein Bca52824_080294 [Brassica carinata]
MVVLLVALLSGVVSSLQRNEKAECADFSDLCDDGATDDLEAVRVWSRVFRSRRFAAAGLLRR